MKQKDLAEEYADLQYKIQQDAPEESPDLSKGVFGHEDIVNAFNAGRESVVENIPELEWEETTHDLEDYFISHNNGWNYRIVFRNRVFCVHLNSNYMGEYLKLSWAKQAANEDYKQLIKQVLGL